MEGVVMDRPSLLSDQERRRYGHIIADWRHDLARMEAGTYSLDTHFGITEMQAKALSFIKAFSAEHGCSPSYKQIGEGIGQKSKAGVYRLVHSLAARGRIRMKPHSARSIEVVT